MQKWKQQHKNTTSFSCFHPMPSFSYETFDRKRKNLSVIYPQNGKKSSMITLGHLCQIKESNTEMQQFSLRRQTSTKLEKHASTPSVTSQSTLQCRGAKLFVTSSKKWKHNSNQLSCGTKVFKFHQLFVWGIKVTF